MKGSEKDPKDMAIRIGLTFAMMADAGVFVCQIVEFLILEELLRPLGGGEGKSRS